MYCDQITSEFIRKLFKIGCVDIHNVVDRANYNTKATPQDNLRSSILSNIYLHAFDKCNVKELLSIYKRAKIERHFLIILKGPSLMRRRRLSSRNILFLNQP